MTEEEKNKILKLVLNKAKKHSINAKFTKYKKIDNKKIEDIKNNI